jgi:subtilisin family serine protease
MEMKTTRRTITWSAALLLGALLSFSVSGLLPPAAQDTGASPREVIVSWRDMTPLEEKERAIRQAGGVAFHHFWIVNASSARLPEAAAEQLLRLNPHVLSIVPNRRLFPLDGLQDLWPAAPIIIGGGGGDGTQFTPLSVQRVGAAPGTLSFTGRFVGVAVVDTGIDATHPDLIRPDGSRVVSEVCRKDVTVSSCDVDVWEGIGHGTGVAGVIAAVHNARDIVGVAPDSAIYNVNVFKILPGPQPRAGDATGGPSTSDGDLIDGLQWIVMNRNTVQPNIRVVNISLGRPLETPENIELENAVKAVHALGIPITVSAGNEPLVEVKDRIPAGYKEVMAIAGTTAAFGTKDASAACAPFSIVPPDTASLFTTDGRLDPMTEIGVTISAPANNWENLVRDGGQCVLQSVGVDLLAKGGGLARNDGTSFAAPLAAGVVALMWEQARLSGTTLTPMSARARIRAGADRIGVAPLDSLSAKYSFDEEREGILWAPGALQ